MNHHAVSKIPATKLLDIYVEFTYCVADGSFSWNEMAPRGGQLSVMQWIRSQGCLWDSLTCMGATTRDNLSVLQWTDGQGCPWDIFTSSSAAEGHVSVLKWIKSQGFP